MGPNGAWQQEAGRHGRGRVGRWAGRVELAANSAMEGALPAAKQTISGPSHDGERGHSTRMLDRDSRSSGEGGKRVG